MHILSLRQKEKYLQIIYNQQFVKVLEECPIAVGVVHIFTIDPFLLYNIVMLLFCHFKQSKISSHRNKDQHIFHMFAIKDYTR